MKKLLFALLFLPCISWGAYQPITGSTVTIIPSVNNRQYSFSASTNSFTLATTPTLITAMCGNATRTVAVYGLRASCTQTTAGITQASVIKYSSQYTGLWSTMSAVAQDTNYVAAISSAVFFTANPTVGTEVGHVDNALIGILAPGNASPNDGYWSPSSWKIKPIILRGTSECLGLNLEAKTVTGGVCSVGWDWIEDSNL